MCFTALHRARSAVFSICLRRFSTIRKYNRSHTALRKVNVANIATLPCVIEPLAVVSPLNALHMKFYISQTHLTRATCVYVYVYFPSDKLLREFKLNCTLREAHSKFAERWTFRRRAVSQFQNNPRLNLRRWT